MKKSTTLNTKTYLENMSIHKVGKLEIRDHHNGIYDIVTEQTMRVIPKHTNWITLFICPTSVDTYELNKTVSIKK